MADDVYRLFDDYAARFARGERPDARAYLARAGGGAEELAALIDRYLEAAPAPAPGEDARAAAAAWLEGEPPLLALRTRRGLRVDAVVDALIAALGLDVRKRAKVKRYYQRLETGLLEPRRVDQRVFDALAETLRASLADVRAWRPRPIEAEPSYRMEPEAMVVPSAPVFADGNDSEPDEIDVLFLEGGNGS